MIKIRGVSGADDINNKIIFEPRGGFIRGRGAAPRLEFPLVYGHRCPYCSNVIQALFKAPKMFSLWPYEETTILSQGEKNSGEIRRTYPDDRVKFGKSCYRMEFRPAEGGSIKLVLRNHIVRHSILAPENKGGRTYNGENVWEEGENTCTAAGIFALREDLLVKDWILFSKFIETELDKYNVPSIKDLFKENDQNFKLLPAVGVAPPVILIIDRKMVVYGFHFQSRPMLAPFRKSGL